MIIKSRSPTMRHVSRTHRVALDWLFDRINLDPKIQIRSIDTNYQLADILTKGNFTRDEWNNLLQLFNISHLSSTRCTKNFSLISCSTMAKMIQEQKEEERVVYGTYDQKPDGSWDPTAVLMLLNFAGSGHPVFRGTRDLERGELRSKKSGKKSIHFNGSTQNIELLLQNGRLRQSAQYLRSSSGYD